MSKIMSNGQTLQTKNNKKMLSGFTIVEITVAIFIMAVLTAGAYMIYGGKSKDLQINSELTTGLRELSSGFASYKNNSSNANYDFNGLTSKELSSFVDKNIFELDSTNTYLFLKRMPEVQFTVLPNRSDDASASTDNKVAKVLTDFSDLKAFKGLSDEEIRKLENIVARHFKETTANVAKIGGNQTSLGAANAGAITIGDPDDDGLVLVDKIF